MIDIINGHIGLKRALNLAHFLEDSERIAHIEKRIKVNRREYRREQKILHAKEYNA